MYLCVFPSKNLFFPQWPGQDAEWRQCFGPDEETELLNIINTTFIFVKEWVLKKGVNVCNSVFFQQL
jgi:hypothetical protein